MSDVAALLAQLTGNAPLSSSDPAMAAIKLARATIDALVLRMGESIEARVVGQLAGGLTQLSATNEAFVLKLPTPLPEGTAVTIRMQPTPAGQPAVTVRLAASVPAPLAAAPAAPQTANIIIAATAIATPPPAAPAGLPAPPPAAQPQQLASGPPMAAPLPTAPVAVSAAVAPPASAPVLPVPPQAPPQAALSPQPAIPPGVAPQPLPPIVPQVTVQLPGLPPQAMPAIVPAVAPTVAVAATLGVIAQPPQQAVPAAVPTSPAAVATTAQFAPPGPPAAAAAPAAVQAVSGEAVVRLPQASSAPAAAPPPPAASLPIATPAPAAQVPAAPAAPTVAVPAQPASPKPPQVPVAIAAQPPTPPASPPPTTLNLTDLGQVAARQDSVAPLLARLAGVVAQGSALPRPVIEVALKLLAGRVDLNRALPDGATLRDAVLGAGVLSNAAGGRSGGTVRDNLLQLRSGLLALLGGEVDAAGPAAHRAALPLRGDTPRAPLPQGPATADTSLPDMVKALLGHTDAALSRLKLLQIASQPSDAARPEAQPARPELRVEIPILLGTETAMLQLQIERDARHRPNPRERAWRMRFAVNFSATGEVGAEVALFGRTASVSVWAADPDTADALEAMLPELSPAFAGHGLDLGAVRVRRGAPAARPHLPGQLLDSAR